MAPNLGWIDEPFGERLAAALGMDVPVDRRATTRTSARSPSTSGARAWASTT